MSNNSPLDLLSISIFCQDNRRSLKDDHTARRVTMVFYRLVNLTRAEIWFDIAPMEEHAMARFRSSVFSSLTLGADDKKRFDAWLKDNDVSPLTVLENFAGNGFKMSVSYVIDQNAFCFSLIGTEATKLHEGMVMTSWSDDLSEVIFIAAFKHFVMCDGGEWPTRDNQARWG